MTKHLRLKMTVGTVLILGGFLLLLGVYTINSQKSQLVNNLRDHGNRIASLTARSCAEYIQRFSFFLMEDQAMSIEQSPDVAFCEIFDAKGNPLLQSGNIVSKDHVGKNRAQYDDGIMVVSQPILAEGVSLGRVEIGLRLDRVERVIQKKTTDMAVLFFGFTLCVILVLNLFFHRLFIKPVLSLADGTQKVAKREFVTIDVGARTDEIGLLARNFNDMSQSLQDLYTNLEGKVRVRTQALEHANEELLVAIESARDMAQKAEEGTLAKSQFLASMSHEIRTPMNAVLGMGEILNESDLDEEQRRYVSILLESGNALLALIEDILDLSKIEAGEMVFEDTAFNLAEIVDKAFKVTAYAGHKKGLDLEYMISPEVPAELVGDPLRLQQILINLLGNGVKFTDSGSVLLEVGVDAETARGAEERVRLVFCVQDSGVGIEPGKLEAIFEKFTQADASTTRRHGGTGLGLSICKLLCEKMGGTIGVQSQVGHGCSVSFSIPYQVTDRHQAEPPVLVGTSLLLFDDRPYAKAALCSRLEQAGANVELALTLDAATHAIKSADHPYDGVLVNTPQHGHEWYAVCDALVACGVDVDRIILLMPSDAALASADHLFGTTLTRPVHIPEVEAAIAGIRAFDSTDALPVQQEPSAANPLRSILLVEDSATNSMLIELYLKDTDHRLFVARNGKEGLDIYKRERIDIVFMDIEMPVMDGFECTLELRAWEKANSRPPVRIVALTAHALNKVKDRILSVGCDAFLTKPVSRKEFVGALRANEEGAG